MNANWLSDVVIVNESSDYLELGSVSIFRSFGDACRKIEYWYGSEADHFVFSGDGVQLIFGGEGQKTTLKPIIPQNTDTEIIKGWLREQVKVVFESRKIKAKKNKLILGVEEALGVFPQSLEGMIAYLGFDR